MNARLRSVVVAFLLLAASALAGTTASSEASVSSSRQVLESEITHWYATILGRNPDSGGLAYWTDYVATDCVNNMWQASRYFHNSDEAWNRGLNNTQRVTYLYQSILHRAPDSGGLSYWVGQLNDRGRSAWVDVVGGISYSDEARGHVWGRMCRNYQMDKMDDIALDYSYAVWLIFEPQDANGTGVGQTSFPGLRWDNDACSNSFDSAFKAACRRHDFGYRNLTQTDDDFTFSTYSNPQLDDKVWDGWNKSDVDYQFRDDMYSACALISGVSGSICRAQISTYFNAVRTAVEYGWRNMISSDLSEFGWQK